MDSRTTVPDLTERFPQTLDTFTMEPLDCIKAGTAKCVIQTAARKFTFIVLSKISAFRVSTVSRMRIPALLT